MLYVIFMILFRLIVKLIFRTTVYGNKQNLRLKGGVIFIANHRNLIDPVMLAVCIPRCVHFMAKKELFDSKIGNWFFRSLLVFPVNRKTADFKSLRQALTLLEEGKAFGIFPEGRRAVTDEMDDFEKGTAFIASKTEAPIVPIYISPSSYEGTRHFRMIVGERILVNEVKDRCGDRRLVEALNARMESEMHALEERMAEIMEKKAKRTCAARS